MNMNFGQFDPDADLHADLVGPARASAVQRRKGFYRNGLKRMFDVVTVALAAPIVLPVVAVLAVMVARHGGQPFYQQERVGKGGRVFRIWKLRSMVPDADARMAEHLASDPAARKEWDETQKLRNDPRITPVGRLLRKSSLDELPQLWNVFRGDMSLVGPRPMMTCQRSIYPGTAYYRMRPGITGYWQISARNQSSFAARAKFDRAYEDDLSLLTDLSVLARTVGVVAKGTGC